jgi:S1-C subfamily serine protease
MRSDKTDAPKLGGAERPLRFEPEPGASAQPWNDARADEAPARLAPLSAAPRGPLSRRAVVGIVAASLAFGSIGGVGATVLLLDGGLRGADLPGQIRQTLVSEQSAIVTVAENVSPAIATLEVTLGASSAVGSGVIYSADGWIVTNKHVVTGANSITVHLKDGRDFPGRVYGIDTLTDLAIVKVEASGLTAATLGRSSSINVGQTAIAIGSPLGVYTNSVTAGIVSAIGREIDTESGRLSGLIQTDAAINHGNSGGALVDSSGAVIGINTAIATEGSGIGFAIPIDIARPIMEQALAGEALSRPWVGVRYVALDLRTATANKLPVNKGAWVTGDSATPAIVPGSPAEAAGLKEGDIIISVEGMEIDELHPLQDLLVQYSPTKTVVLKVLRAGATIDVSVTLGVRPPQ